MLLQLPTLTLWCSSIKYVFKWPKIPVLIRTTKFSEENRNMTRQKKCLLLRVCLVKSKLNQYRRCCLNYALLNKKRERKIHCSSKSFDFYLEWIWLGSMASWQFGMLWYVCFVAIQGQYSQFSVYFASIRLITLVFCLIWFNREYFSEFVLASFYYQAARSPWNSLII